MFTIMDCLCPYEEYKRKQEIEKLLKDLNKQYKKDIKLLLLGTGESGKSTFIRQMRIIYDKGYSVMERKNHIKLIHENIFQSMQSLITAMNLLQIEYEKYENATKNAKLIMHVKTMANLEEPFLSAIKELWNDAGIQACYMRRNEFQLNDSTKYYMTDIDRIAKTDYVPTDQDILRVRAPTSGLIEYVFKVNNVVFRMTDVGGQRSERRKWLHCFDNVKAIIFLAAISEYDQMLKEKEDENRLKESKIIFKAIADHFLKTQIILFLNKIDLLDEKILYSDLNKYFPEFKGPRCDGNAARNFILELFLEIRPKLYHHFTCATDTKNIEVVFTAVKDIILNLNLKEFGLV